MTVSVIRSSFVGCVVGLQDDRGGRESVFLSRSWLEVAAQVRECGGVPISGGYRLTWEAFARWTMAVAPWVPQWEGAFA